MHLTGPIWTLCRPGGSHKRLISRRLLKKNRGETQLHRPSSAAFVSKAKSKLMALNVLAGKRQGSRDKK